MASFGRPPVLRADYLADAQGLLHISRAINIDTSRPTNWKLLVCARLAELAKLLMDAPRLPKNTDEIITDATTKIEPRKFAMLRK